MADYENDLNLKMDEIFGFNLSRSLDWVNYDFWQYKLNQIYRPLVRYFVKEFSEHLESLDESKANEEITLFIDFFKLYFFQWDFWYFKNKYSSFKYKVPYGADYSWNDTELWWASKDCYYVKTSDVVNSIDVQIPRSDLSTDNISLKFFKRSQPNDNWDYILSVDSSEILDEDENLIWYNIYVYNWDEAKSKKLEVIMDKLEELQIQAWWWLINSIKDFLNKRWRDYFIHKNLKEFLTWELEWYLFQVLKWDTKWRIDILEVKNQIEKLKLQHPDDPDYVMYKSKEIYAQMDSNIEPSIYQDAYIRCSNFINILSDLEEFKAKLWTKKRKAIKQEYCISLWKIKELETLIPRRDHILNYIFENEKQIQEWKDLWMSDNPSVDDDSLVVDTKNFEWEQRENLINLVNEDSIIWRLYNSDNYQALSYMEEDDIWKIDCIYIDPPYNTKNNEFVYKDWYKDSTWWTMISERLTKIYDLMSDDSLIFISLDDNEQSNLKLICDKIFWIENFIAIFPRLTTKSWKTPTTYMVSHDYVICYTKWKQNIFIWEKFIDNSYKYSDEYVEERWMYNLKQPLDCNSISYSPSLDYPIEHEWITYYPWWDYEEYKKRKWWNYLKKDYARRRSKDLYEFWLKNWRIVFKNWRIYTKGYLNATIEKDGNKGYVVSIRDKERKISTLDFVDNEYSNDIAKKQLYSLVANSVKFDYPKPITLIKKLVSTYYKKSAFVLDFFAWSWSTWHAIMNLNKEDEWYRKFVEIELWKYFDDVTLVRTKKVQYSQNWKEWKAVDNDWTQWIVEYTKLNQYEDWFSTNGYLTLLNDDIEKLSELKDVDNVTQIISPLESLKEKIYNIDDELSNDQLLEISNNK